MISSVVNPRDVHVALEALRAGALAVAESLPSPNDAQYESKRRFLVGSVTTLARANPARRVAATPSLHRVPSPSAPSIAGSPRPAPRVAQAVGIITSTGGPTALMEVLKALRPDEAPPILVVQHIARGFGAGLARWLADVTGHKVKLAEEGESLVRWARLHRAGTTDTSASRREAPSPSPTRRRSAIFAPRATHLLRSMAAPRSVRAAPPWCSPGMGRDGAEGGPRPSTTPAARSPSRTRRAASFTACLERRWNAWPPQR